ncbi:cobalamin biosynthesis protein [Phormidium tenue FACHB-886]|nr:cobalamin biosynthesis protein [Phormidium tenue FACHB-886]
MGCDGSLALPHLDRLGVPASWRKGSGDWAGVEQAIAQQLPVQVIQEAGSMLWQANLPQEHSLFFEELPHPPKARIWISPIQRRFAPVSDFAKVQWHPPVLWVGLGWEKGTPRSTMERAIQEVCRAHHLAEAAIAGIATLESKASDLALLTLCDDRHWLLRYFAAEVLSTVPVPNPSTVVSREVGTPSVAEAAAILADIEHLAFLRVPKRVVRFPNQLGAVTIAIAQSHRESTV